jgi:FkbM family methyltransferase
MYEPLTVKIIRQFVKPGDRCFDIGANCGALTLAMAQATRAPGTVIAFEPGPPLYRRLKQNLSMNPWLDNVVEAFCLGIGEKRGTLRWSEDPDNRGNASLAVDGGGDGVEVLVTTLDDFVHRTEFAHIEFLKIDVEGMEYDVFKGGLNTLKTMRPKIYFETMKEFAEYRGFDIFAGIEDMLRPLGYKFYRVPELTETNLQETSINTLALP